MSCVSDSVIQLFYCRGPSMFGAFIFSPPSCVTTNDCCRFAAFHSGKEQEAEAVPTVPGYFRLLTLLGLWIFAQEEVEVVVMEVGCGGRFDATNIVGTSGIGAWVGVRTEYKSLAPFAIVGLLD